MNAVADYAKVSFREEASWNEIPPANMVLKNLPFTKEALDYTKQTAKSTTIRSDRNIRDLVRVGVDAGGSIDFEVSDYPELVLTFLAATLFSAGPVLSGTAATGVLTSSGNYANAETIVIGGRTLTIKTALSTGPTVPNEVLLSTVSEAATIANIVKAINGTGTPGTEYSVGTLPSVFVTAVGAAHTVTVTAIGKGTPGNAITTTEVCADASWGGATLTGGANLALDDSFEAVDVGNEQGYTVFTGTGTPTLPPVGRAIILSDLFVNGDTYVGIVTASAPGTFTVSPNLQTGGTTIAPKAIQANATYNWKEMRNGVTPRSFFIEKLFTDLNAALGFSGMMVDSFKMTVDSRKIITGTLNFVGGNAYEASDEATEFSVSSRDNNDGNSLSASGNVGAFKAGTSTAEVKTVTIEFKNNLRGQDAIRNLFLIGVGAGQCEIAVTISAYFNSLIMFNVMKADGVIDLFIGFNLGTYCFALHFPRMKLGKGLPDAGSINSDVMLSVDAQPLFSSDINATVAASLAANT